MFLPRRSSGPQAVGVPSGPKPAFVLEAYQLLKPLLFRLDPETAHELTLRTLETGAVPHQHLVDDPLLAVDLFGRRLSHPIGLAAGFDKDARVYGRMFRLGFSFVEVGGVTPLAQSGNARPRVFRLPAEGAVINRMGFPNAGAGTVERRLRARDPDEMLGVNLASNTNSHDPVGDFAGLAARLGPHADYLTLDISCPNTRNGRLFLEPSALHELLAAVRTVVPFRSGPALVAKLSPDIDDARLDTLLGILLDSQIDGLIVSNTTVDRAGLRAPQAAQVGGLSGKPLFAASTAMLARVARATARRLPLLGVGGIASGADAYAKIRAGATAIQLYTALVYGGPALVARIARDLAALVRRDGFASLAEATAAG